MIKKAINTMIAAAGKNQSMIAAELNVTRANMTHYVQSDFLQIKRFIKIAELCNFEIVARNKKGTEIKLTENKQ